VEVHFDQLDHARLYARRQERAATGTPVSFTTSRLLVQLAIDPQLATF
jgi:hypothetical protein